ncbi:MAG: hypothetical protein ABI275_00850 [Terrimesophilobacter sp.]
MTNVLARGRLAALVTISVLVGTMLMGAFGPAAGPAAAENTPAAPTTLTISAPADGAFIGSNGPFTVRGTKAEGSSVAVSGTTASGSAGNGSVTCSVQADPTTQWACQVPGLPNGAGAQITATQQQPVDNPADAGASTAARPANSTEVTIRVDVLGAPVLSGPATFLTSGTVSGSAMPGAGVVAGVSGSAEPGCVSKALGNGYWSCSLAVPSGTYRVSARQSKVGIGAPGDLSEASAAKTVMVDKTAPDAPVVISPRAGSRVATQPTVYAGNGETRGWVDAYVDGRIVCSSSVVEAKWSCSAGGIRPGAHYVQAIQRDLAGNYSAPSARQRVFYGAKAAAAPPALPSTTPTTSASPMPTPTPPVTPAPVPSTPLPTLPGPEPPAAAGSNWGTPTGFGGAMSTPSDLLGGSNWPLIPLAVALFIALIALPLRLLATASRGRFPSRPQFFGRNQAAAADVHGRWSGRATGALAVAAAAALIVLTTGVGAEVRYLRLAAAVVLALAVLNAVGVAMVTRTVSRVQRVAGQLKFLPLLLLGAALVAVISRAAGFEPPLVAGVVIGMTFGAPLAARPRAMVSLAELSAVAGLSILAWVAHGALGIATGFWASFASESLAALCLSGVGSLVILSLPIGRLPGRVILEWSAPAWTATIVASTALAAGVAFGNGLANFPAMTWLLTAAAFAAVSVATWAWFRFVEEPA